jgi:hypothetical protein
VRARVGIEAEGESDEARPGVFGNAPNGSTIELVSALGDEDFAGVAVMSGGAGGVGELPVRLWGVVGGRAKASSQPATVDPIGTGVNKPIDDHRARRASGKLDAGRVDLQRANVGTGQVDGALIASARGGEAVTQEQAPLHASSSACRAGPGSLKIVPAMPN